MKQHKRLRFVSIVCLAALLVSCLPGAYAYGVSSAWAREELDAMAALDLIPALLEERGDLRENITRLEMCALAVQAYEHYTGEELSLPDETPFPDTNDPIAAKSYAAGFALGYEDGTFRPDGSITRAEFCAMVATALNLPANSSALTFTDVSSDAWYAGAISAMAARGFVAGDDDGAFRSDSTITYQEIVTILSSVAAWASMDGYELSQQDLSAEEWLEYYDFADWAQAPARNLDELGALVGDLAPTDNATRGVSAGMLCSLMEDIHLIWD